MTRIAIVLSAIVIAVVAVGALFLVYEDLSAPPIVIADPVAEGPITVAIAGAVNQPGVYEVSGDARVIDVINAAGGVSDDADLAQVNQARRVYDEDLLDIPRQAPPTPTPAPVPTTGNAHPVAAGADDGASDDLNSGGLININTAPVEQLVSLPGIGPAIAERVVDYRTENGPFRAVDELARVNGISSAMVDEFRALVTVGE
jgi:competence protein ComEA